MEKIIENLKKNLKDTQATTQEDGNCNACREDSALLTVFPSIVELDLFTKYLKAARDGGTHPEEGKSNRKLDTHDDVTKAFTQQHLPTIPQFYEHVRNFLCSLPLDRLESMFFLDSK